MNIVDFEEDIGPFPERSFHHEFESCQELLETDGSIFGMIELEEEYFSNESAGVEEQVKSLPGDEVVPAPFRKIEVHQFDKIQLHLFNYLENSLHFIDLALFILWFFESPLPPVQLPIFFYKL